MYMGIRGLILFIFSFPLVSHQSRFTCPLELLLEVHRIWASEAWLILVPKTRNIPVIIHFLQKFPLVSYQSWFTCSLGILLGVIQLCVQRPYCTMWMRFISLLLTPLCFCLAVLLCHLGHHPPPPPLDGMEDFCSSLRVRGSDLADSIQHATGCVCTGCAHWPESGCLAWTVGQNQLGSNSSKFPYIV